MSTRQTGRSRRLSVAEAGTAPTLPPWKAFVVQFSSETNSAAQTFSGRVEHLNSAHRTRFESLEELAAVLTRMLGELGER